MPWSPLWQDSQEEDDQRAYENLLRLMQKADMSRVGDKRYIDDLLSLVKQTKFNDGRNPFQAVFDSNKPLFGAMNERQSGRSALAKKLIAEVLTQHDPAPRPDMRGAAGNAIGNAAGSIQEALFAAMMNGGSGGPGSAHLPRVSGPSDADIAALTQRLIQGAIAPYDAAQANLAGAKVTSAGEINAAEQAAKQGITQNNAQFKQDASAGNQHVAEQLAAVLAAAQQNAAANQQGFAAMNGMGDAVAQQSRAAQDVLSTQQALQQAYSQRLMQSADESGRDALNTAARIGESGNSTLNTVYGQALSSILGQRSQAQAQAQARGDEYGMSARQAAQDKNAELAAREAEMNQSRYVDPLDRMGKMLGIQQELQQFHQSQQPEWDWDYDTLTSPHAQQAAYRSPGDLQGALDVLDNARGYHIQKNTFDDTTKKAFDDAEQQLVAQWRQGGPAARRRQVRQSR